MRKVIQISATTRGSKDILYALCDDSTIHRYDLEIGWVLVVPIPHSHAAKMEELEDTMSFFAEEEDDDSQS